MKLDRNINNDGRGKYALLKLRVFEEFAKGGEIQELPYDIRQALDVLERAKILDWGDTPDTEFFVIRLKDRYAQSALKAYAEDAAIDDVEYAAEIERMVQRSGPDHPNCRRPD